MKRPAGNRLQRSLRMTLLRSVSAAAALLLAVRGSAAKAQAPAASSGAEVVVNDVHSKLNETRVDRVVRPASVAEVQAVIRQAKAEGKSISIAGGRHAMGGQQFGTGTILLDTSRLTRVLAFDAERGLISVEAGIQWPALLEYLEQAQRGKASSWGIRQKQTGADRLSIGGALSANVHGRGLRFQPMIADVESFRLVDAAGNVSTCSRTENSALFRLAIGGYGLFGVITDVTLRLMPRQKVERVVRLIDLKELASAIEERIRDGYLYGDFQFDIDPTSTSFLTRGVFSCYRPVPNGTPIPATQKQLSMENWSDLFFLAHTAKAKAFEAYSSYYLGTNGQVYWSDTHQLAEYLDNYHEALDLRLGPEGRGSEMISEVYVPRASLPAFMENVRSDLRAGNADVIYGTIRFIERAEESFLPWAKDRYACVIFNLHTAHTPQAIEKTAANFQRIIARALELRGSYYLTYHHWATRSQTETAYPQFVDFLKLKKKYDPDERFQSDWYRFYMHMFVNVLGR
jgi:FAD/FMN-containing dehydrogenase